MGHATVGMEYLSASDVYPIQASLNAVSSSDALVLLLGYRYGYIPENSDISIVELEYREALEKEIPVYAFIVSDDTPVTIKDFEL